MTRIIIASAALAAALLWGYWNHTKAQAHAERVHALELDLAASEATLQTVLDSARVDAAQSTQRNTLTKPVKQALVAVKHGDPSEVRPTASDAQLDRLRVLAAAANAAAASAVELP